MFIVVEYMVAQYMLAELEYIVVVIVKVIGNKLLILIIQVVS